MQLIQCQEIICQRNQGIISACHMVLLLSLQISVNDSVCVYKAGVQGILQHIFCICVRLSIMLVSAFVF